MQAEDLLIITADHGCDPLSESTDHSRENVPCLIYFNGCKSENFGTKSGFNHVFATVLNVMNVTDVENVELLKKFSLI